MLSQRKLSKFNDIAKNYPVPPYGQKTKYKLHYKEKRNNLKPQTRRLVN